MRPLVRPPCFILVRPLVRPLVPEESGAQVPKKRGTERHVQGQEGAQELNFSKLPYVVHNICKFGSYVMDVVSMSLSVYFGARIDGLIVYTGL